MINSWKRHYPLLSLFVFGFKMSRLCNQRSSKSNLKILLIIIVIVMYNDSGSFLQMHIFFFLHLKDTRQELFSFSTVAKSFLNVETRNLALKTKQNKKSGSARFFVWCQHFFFCSSHTFFFFFLFHSPFFCLPLCWC